MKIKADKSALPISIVAEGKVMKENLKVAKLTPDDVKNLLKKAGINRVKDCLVLSVDKAGEVFAQAYNKKYTTFSTRPLGEVSE